MPLLTCLAMTDVVLPAPPRHAQFNRAEVDGRVVNVNKALRPEDVKDTRDPRAGYGQPSRGGYDDRMGPPSSLAYRDHAPGAASASARPSGGRAGYRVTIKGLPDHYTWRSAWVWRTVAACKLYAVDRPGRLAWTCPPRAGR